MFQSISQNKFDFTLVLLEHASQNIKTINSGNILFQNIKTINSDNILQAIVNGKTPLAVIKAIFNKCIDSFCMN